MIAGQIDFQFTFEVKQRLHCNAILKPHKTKTAMGSEGIMT